MRVFVSFDERHDRDLYALFLEETRRSGTLFEVVSDGSTAMQRHGWSKHPRASIRSADGLVFLCGEHTEESVRMSTELSIAREEEKPYMLVWGRREKMCTKPEGALASDGMYSWTREILENQMGVAIRAATPRVIPEAYKRRSDSGGSPNRSSKRSRTEERGKQSGDS